MSEVSFNDNAVIGKLLRSLGPFGFVAMDPERVNLDDLLAPMREGRIVRVEGDPATAIVVFASEQAETLGCVASWISDEQ